MQTIIHPQSLHLQCYYQGKAEIATSGTLPGLNTWKVLNSGEASLPTQTKKWKLGRGLDTVCNCIALTITLGAAGQSKQYLCKTQWGNRCVAAGYKGRCRKGRVWQDVRYVKSMCRCVSLEEYT